MKEIYLICCPITGEAKVISKCRFGQFPNGIIKNPKYRKWRDRVREENLRPHFKLIDLVNEKDLDLIYEMYLTLFSSWNINLLNFYIPQYKVAKAIKKIPKTIKQSGPGILKTEKFHIMDLPNIPSILERISEHFIGKKMSAKDRIMMYELILACSLNVSCPEAWTNLRKISLEKARNRAQSIIDSEKYDCKYLHQLIDYSAISSTRKEGDSDLFVNINKITLTKMLSMLNYILAFFQHQVIFNDQVWNNAYDLRMYLLNKPEYNRKYEVVELYRQLMRNRSIQISPKEFNQMTSKIQEASY